MSKYGAQKTMVDGIMFASKKEARRYSELMLLLKAGHISGLVLQHTFELAKGVKFAGEKRAKPPLRYVADFIYSDPRTGTVVVEDCKGMKTPAFNIKRHLMLALLGIDVRLT